MISRKGRPPRKDGKEILGCGRTGAVPVLEVLDTIQAAGSATNRCSRPDRLEGLRARATPVELLRHGEPILASVSNAHP